MLSPVKIASWAIVVCRDDRDLQGDRPGSLRAFGNTLVKAFKAMGINMPDQPDHVEWVGDLGRYPEIGQLHQAVTNVTMAQRSRGKAPDVIFFIIPRRGMWLSTCSSFSLEALVACTTVAVSIVPEAGLVAEYACRCCSPSELICLLGETGSGA
jgi:hypothetical protein